MAKKRFYIANDHAGFKLKLALVNFLETRGYKVTDLGSSSEDAVDYPDYAAKVCKSVLKDRNSLGIAICGTGMGMCIACNKFRKIRAAMVYSEHTARRAVEHNNANIFCFGGRSQSAMEVKEYLSEILKSRFSREVRHGRRNAKIDKLG
ncbi:Galactose-6-phosphate isomerase subunit LacB [uncultured archaeon]|nr:Galactose-6-phosphate isomerase subunit LacB [uncultured archaeon]